MNLFGSPYGYNSYSNALGAGGVLMLIAVIAAIVCTVIVYRKYARSSTDRLLDFRNPNVLRSFLRFDTLIIDRILIVCYIFLALLLPFIALATGITAMIADFSRGFMALLGAILLCAIEEVALRILFEFSMMMVVIARNVSDIRDATVGGGRPRSGAAPRRVRSAQPSAQQVASAAPAPVPTPMHTPAPAASQPVQANNPSASTVTCPHCGATLPAGVSFCASCGKRI